MDLHAVLALYDQEQRIDIEFPGARKERLAHIVRFVRPAPGMNRNNYQPVVAQNGQNLMFRLTGTNRTLKQQVSFVGNFVTLTNQLPGANAQFQYADKAQDANQQQFVPSLQNSGIKGRLQVGSGREVEFNAVPVKP